MSGVPSTRFENDKAKSNIVRIKADDVLGITLDGRYVSSAACEMLSNPTKDMIASEMPSRRLPDVGQCVCIVWTRIIGFHAKMKPHTKINVSLTTSNAATISLMRDD